MNDSDQYNRKPNVIIRGIPQEKSADANHRENTRELVLILASRLGINLRDYDMCAAHRLYGRDTDDSADAPIIVRLNSYDKKYELMKEARNTKPTSSELGLGKNLPIIVDEQLTKKTLALLHAAKCVKNKKLVEAAWCRDCKE